MSRDLFQQKIFNIKSNSDFEKLSFDIFYFQIENNPVYSEYVRNLKIDLSVIDSIDKIPFLPVELFKTHKVLTGDEKFDTVFTSSGTTSENMSKHLVKDVLFYEKVFLNIFSDFYGSPDEYVILALLPSYLEREGSSLIYMMERLIQKTNKAESGFYLDDFEKLNSTLKKLSANNQKTILFGVTFALLDFVAKYKIDFPELIIMETGGMKGRRKEMIRDEVHSELCKGFNVEAIHSEYGMTELLSQAYSYGNGKFKTPNWMKVIVRDPYDPLSKPEYNSTGGINIIDLANIDSCAFIATQDLGKAFSDGTFEILGRFDFSDVRGCNLLVE
jgi:phenylacetate-coenzyme A ligase PaaK-like adenylate-forming protein